MSVMGTHARSVCRRSHRRCEGRRRIRGPYLCERREARHPPQAVGQRLSLRDGRAARPRQRYAQAHQGACRTAGLDGCLDLPEGRTAISRPPAAMRGAASNTAITRAFARCARAPSTITCWPSPRACRPSARKVQEHLALRGLPREKVLATVVHLLEATLIRVGSDEYAAPTRAMA